MRHVKTRRSVIQRWLRKGYSQGFIKRGLACKRQVKRWLGHAYDEGEIE